MATIGLILLALCCFVCAGAAFVLPADGRDQKAAKVVVFFVGLGWGSHIILSVAGVIG